MTEQANHNEQIVETREEIEAARENSHNEHEQAFDDDVEISSVSEKDIGEYRDEDTTYVTSESIRKRYDDIIEQNTELSNQAAENIKLMDIDEGSADMVANTIQEIEQACNQKTWSERATSFLPAPLKKSVNKIRKNTDANINKQRSVTELATRHFDSLKSKRDDLTENLSQIYQIRDKLEQSSGELGKMEQLLIGHIDELNEKSNVQGQASGAKIERLKSKEMVVQVQNQYMTQRDLINQIDSVQYVAEQVVDSINNTLPTIKSNFIDQVSITAGLKNMKDLKNSVDRTREMVITLSEQSFEDTRNIMTEVQKSGMGYTDEEMNRIEKLHHKKQEFQKQMTQDFYNSDKKKDKQMARLGKMINQQQSFLTAPNESIEEQSEHSNKEESESSDKKE